MTPFLLLPLLPFSVPPALLPPLGARIDRNVSDSYGTIVPVLLLNDCFSMMRVDGDDIGLTVLLLPPAPAPFMAGDTGRFTAPLTEDCEDAAELLPLLSRFRLFCEPPVGPLSRLRFVWEPPRAGGAGGRLVTWL